MKKLLVEDTNVLYIYMYLLWMYTYWKEGIHIYNNSFCCYRRVTWLPSQFVVHYVRINTSLLS